MAEQERPDKWRISPRLAKIENTIAPDASSLAIGKNLYLRECQQCHGDTGKGDAAYLGKKMAELMSVDVLGGCRTYQPLSLIYCKIALSSTLSPA